MLFKQFHDALFEPGFQKFPAVFLERLVYVFYGPEFLDKVRGSFFSHTRHSFYVVRWVSAQTLVVGNVLRCKPVALFDCRLVIQDGVVNPLLERVHLYFFPSDELHGIHIARSDNHLDRLIDKLFYNRCDDVVCLKPLPLVNGNGKCFEYISRCRQLLYKRVLRFLSRPFVVIIRFVTHRWSC